MELGEDSGRLPVELTNSSEEEDLDFPETKEHSFSNAPYVLAVSSWKNQSKRV